MLGLWWFMFIVDLGYLLFRYLKDIKAAQVGDVYSMLDFEREIIKEKVKPTPIHVVDQY
jgi:hypothetical protein